MKRIIGALLLAVMLLSVACAETMVQVNTELEGHETQYRLYEREVYEAPCEHPGQLVKVKFTSRVYGDREYKRYVNVYLPYMASDNPRKDMCSRYYLYNAFCDGLFK